MPLHQKKPRLTLLLWFALVFSSNVSAFEWKDLWQRQDQQARTLLKSGDAEKAADVFTDNRWRGVSHFEAGNFEQAVNEFNAHSDPVARYNRGVAETMGGNYDAAIESFESVLGAQPDNEDAAHNLSIARELAKQQNEQNQQQQQNSEQSDDNPPDNNQSDDNSNNQDSSQQNSERGNSQSQESQSESGETTEPSQPKSPPDSTDEQSRSDSQSGESSEQQGELAEEASETRQSMNEQSDEEALEELQQAMRAEESDGTDKEPQGTEAASVPVSQEISEENQATEQWLRRIPDDPSQLLRNKIKLNHLLEHPDVGDTPEPW